MHKYNEMASVGVVTVVLVSALLSYLNRFFKCPTTFSLEHGDPSALGDASVNLYIPGRERLPGRSAACMDKILAVELEMGGAGITFIL